MYIMSALRISTPKKDFDAAQALLDLQCPIKTENNTWHERDNVEAATNVFWNGILPTVAPARPNRSRIQPPDIYSPAVKFPFDIENLSRGNATGTLERHCSNVIRQTDYLDDGNINRPLFFNKNISTNKKVTTRDFGTQTEENLFYPNIELMETTIKTLYDRIQTLESQLKSSVSTVEGSENSMYTDEENHEQCSFDSQDSDKDYDVEDDIKQKNNLKYARQADVLMRSQHSKRNKNIGQPRVLTNHNVKSNSELVPIGDGNALIPFRVLKHINWNSYTSATRKLLTAVFSRRVLATHSLTGKPSPAFPNKPAKKKLDPAIVNDIVQTVVERCSVAENVVRTSITTKCADESKMFRSRQKNKSNYGTSRNRENIPPTFESESD